MVTLSLYLANIVLQEFMVIHVSYQGSLWVLGYLPCLPGCPQGSLPFRTAWRRSPCCRRKWRGWCCSLRCRAPRTSWTCLRVINDDELVGIYYVLCTPFTDIHQSIAKLKLLFLNYYTNLVQIRTVKRTRLVVYSNTRIYYTRTYLHTHKLRLCCWLTNLKSEFTATKFSG